MLSTFLFAASSFCALVLLIVTLVFYFRCKDPKGIWLAVQRMYTGWMLFYFLAGLIALGYGS